MKFHIKDSDTYERFLGVVSPYNGITQNHSIYFSSDGETVMMMKTLRLLTDIAIVAINYVLTVSHISS